MLKFAMIFVVRGIALTWQRLLWLVMLQVLGFCISYVLRFAAWSIG